MSRVNMAVDDKALYWSGTFYFMRLTKRCVSHSDSDKNI